MIFIDSSVFIAYANTKDFHHEKAVEIFGNVAEGVYGKALFSDYIFTEVVTVMLLKTGFSILRNLGSISFPRNLNF